MNLIAVKTFFSVAVCVHLIAPQAALAAPVTVSMFVRTANGEESSFKLGTFPTLILFAGANRFGEKRDGEVGGDAWATAETAALASILFDDNWNDISNMNGGLFLPSCPS